MGHAEGHHRYLYHHMYKQLQTIRERCVNMVIICVSTCK